MLSVQIILNPGIQLVDTLYLVPTWIWSSIPQRNSSEPMGLTFHSVFPLKGGFTQAEWVPLWSSFLFSQMKETLNSDNGVRHVCFWLLINISFYILNLYGPQNSLKMKKNSILGHPFAGLFLRTHLFPFCSIEIETPWQLATDSYFTAVESTLCVEFLLPLLVSLKYLPSKMN